MAAFLLSLAATLIALFAAVVSYIVFRSQADPEVIVYPASDERRPTLIILVIENIGKACAHDVSFAISAELPWKAFDGGDDPPAVAKMATGPLITGIPFLPPGGRRVITWGQYAGLRKALGSRDFTVTASYTSAHYGVPSRSKHKTTCPLEVDSFAATDASDHNHLKRIAEEVKKLSDSVGKIAG